MAGRTRDHIKRCLASLPLFSDLAGAELEDLAAATRELRPYRKGTRIFDEGASADCCYVLMRGRARVVLSGASGVDVLLQMVTAPALVGEVALLDRSTRSASLVTAEECQVLQIPGAALERLRRNPAFEQRLVVGLVAILRNADEHLRVIATLPARARVIWCLVRLARDNGGPAGNLVAIPKPTNTELAELAGCTRETVNRVLNRLRKKKLVTWDHDTMHIDVDGLQRYLPPG